MPSLGTVVWFSFFWLVMPFLAHAENGWPGVVLLLVLYAAGVVGLRAWFGSRRPA